MASHVTSPINSNVGDISSEEEKKIQENPKEKEVIIAVAGKSGAGKTTLAYQIIGEKVEVEASPDPTTEKSKVMSGKKEGLSLIVLD